MRRAEQFRRWNREHFTPGSGHAERAIERYKTTGCPLEIKGALESTVGKANLLMQAYISGLPVRAFALVSDCTFIAQSAARMPLLAWREASPRHAATRRACRCPR